MEIEIGKDTKDRANGMRLTIEIKGNKKECNEFKKLIKKLIDDYKALNTFIQPVLEEKNVIKNKSIKPIIISPNNIEIKSLNKCE